MPARGPYGNAAEELAFSFRKLRLASPPQRGGGRKAGGVACWGTGTFRQRCRETGLLFSREKRSRKAGVRTAAAEAAPALLHIHFWRAAPSWKGPCPSFGRYSKVGRAWSVWGGVLSMKSCHRVRGLIHPEKGRGDLSTSAIVAAVSGLGGLFCQAAGGAGIGFPSKGKAMLRVLVWLRVFGSCSGRGCCARRIGPAPTG